MIDLLDRADRIEALGDKPHGSKLHNILFGEYYPCSFDADNIQVTQRLLDIGYTGKQIADMIREGVDLTSPISTSKGETDE